mgnify:CR=1 FL=1|jgi:hypothetical protein
MSNQIFSDLVTSYRTLNYTLYRLVEVSNTNNDLLHQSIICIPSISKIFKHIQFLSKQFIRSKNHIDFVIPLINANIRPNVITLNTIIYAIRNHIEFAYTPYLNKHEPYYSLDFYNAIHASFYEHINILTDILLS